MLFLNLKLTKVHKNRASFNSQKCPTSSDVDVKTSECIKTNLEFNSNEPDLVEKSSATCLSDHSTARSVKDDADKADKSQSELNSEALYFEINKNNDLKRFD